MRGEAASKALPCAIQVADRWHLLENANAAFFSAVRNVADSGEAGRLNRDDAARDSEMMSPGISGMISPRDVVVSDRASRNERRTRLVSIRAKQLDRSRSPYNNGLEVNNGLTGDAIAASYLACADSYRRSQRARPCRPMQWRVTLVADARPATVDRHLGDKSRPIFTLQCPFVRQTISSTSAFRMIAPS